MTTAIKTIGVRTPVRFIINRPIDIGSVKLIRWGVKGSDINEEIIKKGHIAGIDSILETDIPNDIRDEMIEKIGDGEEGTIEIGDSRIAADLEISQEEIAGYPGIVVRATVSRILRNN